MPSILSINTVPGSDIFESQPSQSSVLFSSELKSVFTNINFPSLFPFNSIPSNRLQPVEGVNVAQTTLSGYRDSLRPGQIAYKTITSYNLDTNAVKGPQGGVPAGTVIFYYGVPAEEGGRGVPEGYLKADGSFVLVSQYRELFEAIEYRYGENGEAQFRLPTVTPPLNAMALIKF